MGCEILVLTRNSTELSFPKQVIAKVNKLQKPEDVEFLRGNGSKKSEKTEM